MDVHVPTKPTTSDLCLGDNKIDGGRYSPRAVETSIIGDNSQGNGSIRKVSTTTGAGEIHPDVNKIDPTILTNQALSTEEIDSGVSGLTMVDKGCGDIQLEVEIGTSKEYAVELSLLENVLAKELASSSSSSSTGNDGSQLGGREEDLDGNDEITWKWEQALHENLDDGQVGIKCVDVLYEIGSDLQSGQECVGGDGNVLYRSTPVMEVLDEEGKVHKTDYSDISSEAPADFDVSAEASCHHGHHPSLFSTSIEDDDDDDDDDDEDDEDGQDDGADEDDDDESTGFHSHEYKRVDVSDEYAGRSHFHRGRRSINEYDDFGDDDLNDPDLRLWLRRKTCNQSTDNSAQSDSIEEELARLDMQAMTQRMVTVADKGVQVCEDDIQREASGPEAFKLGHLSNWLREVPSVVVTPKFSRQTQTLMSYLRGGQLEDEAIETATEDEETLAEGSAADGIVNGETNEEMMVGGDNYRLSAGGHDWAEPVNDDSKLLTPTGAAMAAEAAERWVEKMNTSKDSQSADELAEYMAKMEGTSGVETEEHNLTDSMSECIKLLLNTIQDIDPVPSADGSSNVWMIPAHDEKGRCINLILEDGEVCTIYVFRPSRPSTVAETQTSEEEFNLLANTDENGTDSAGGS